MQIKVRAHTKARKEKVVAVSDTALEIWVKEKPLENQANIRIIQLVALHFGVPVKSVRIVKGHQSPSKILSVGPVGRS